VPQSVVYHVGGGTLPATSPFKLYLNYRNNLLMLGNNLAKTYALKMSNEGWAVEKAAQEGVTLAAKVIFQRKCLDIMSALVYLVTLRWKYFKTVLKAHKDFSSLMTMPCKEDVIRYLEKDGSGKSVRGIYSRWIVLRAILKGEDIFSCIKREDFYKI